MPAPRPRHSCQIVAYSPRHARASVPFPLRSHAVACTARPWDCWAAADPMSANPLMFSARLVLARAPVPVVPHLVPVSRGHWRGRGAGTACDPKGLAPRRRGLRGSGGGAGPPRVSRKPGFACVGQSVIMAGWAWSSTSLEDRNQIFSKRVCTKQPLPTGRRLRNHAAGNCRGPKGGWIRLSGAGESIREKRLRTRSGRVPDASHTIELEETDASHTIELEETDASRTRPEPFLPEGALYSIRGSPAPPQGPKIHPTAVLEKRDAAAQSQCHPSQILPTTYSAPVSCDPRDEFLTKRDTRESESRGMGEMPVAKSADERSPIYSPLSLWQWP
eukprot:gene9351-biopygen3208